MIAGARGPLLTMIDNSIAAGIGMPVGLQVETTEGRSPFNHKAVTEPLYPAFLGSAPGPGRCTLGS